MLPPTTQPLADQLQTLYRQSLETSVLRDRISRDPIQFPKKFTTKQDQEIVGLLTAIVSYGRVATICKTAEKLVRLLQPTPTAYVRALRVEQERPTFLEFRHRFTTGLDLLAMLSALQQIYRSYESLEDFFLAGDTNTPTIQDALESFCVRILEFDFALVYQDKKPTIRQQCLTKPSNGSGCKRLCMFLRWMIRSAAPDLGCWKKFDASRLLIPVDTHVLRFSREFHLCQQTAAGWKAAIEITTALRRFDPADPTKFDFAIAHLGISKTTTADTTPTTAS